VGQSDDEVAYLAVCVYEGKVDSTYNDTECGLWDNYVLVGQMRDEAAHQEDWNGDEVDDIYIHDSITCSSP
jgi:hypothetical protein